MFSAITTTFDPSAVDYLSEKGSFCLASVFLISSHSDMNSQHLTSAKISGTLVEKDHSADEAGYPDYYCSTVTCPFGYLIFTPSQ